MKYIKYHFVGIFSPLRSSQSLSLQAQELVCNEARLSLSHQLGQGVVVSQRPRLSQSQQLSHLYRMWWRMVSHHSFCLNPL
jgi:hypothetical protein